jgi:hypothetical protein
MISKSTRRVKLMITATPEHIVALSASLTGDLTAPASAILTSE